jgi:hypothetical protein
MVSLTLEISMVGRNSVDELRQSLASLVLNNVLKVLRKVVEPLFSQNSPKPGMDQGSLFIAHADAEVVLNEVADSVKFLISDFLQLTAAFVDILKRQPACAKARENVK